MKLQLLNTLLNTNVHTVKCMAVDRVNLLPKRFQGS